jgi:hypothetical protein
MMRRDNPPKSGLHLFPTEIQVLDQHQKELFYIFQLYAFLDMSTTEAMQKENTMNITEFQMPGFAICVHCLFCSFSTGPSRNPGINWDYLTNKIRPP